MSPLRAWWTGEVCVSVLPLMCAPTQVCITCSGPNSSFEACTHKSVSTDTGDIWPQFKARGSLREGDELNRHRQTDWLILDLGCYWWHTKRLVSVCLICRLQNKARAILFIMILVSYLVPKLINVPTSALLHVVDAFISALTICLNCQCKW